MLRYEPADEKGTDEKRKSSTLVEIGVRGRPTYHRSGSVGTP